MADQVVRNGALRGGATLRGGGTSPLLLPPLTATTLSTRTTSETKVTQTMAVTADTKTKA